MKIKAGEETSKTTVNTKENRVKIKPCESKQIPSCFSV
jgi:hypothetical protein